MKFRQVVNRCKRVVEAAKLVYSNKAKEASTSQKLGSRDFGQIANSVLTALPPLFHGPEVFSSASDIAKLFAKNISNNSNLDGCSVSLPPFPSRANLKFIICNSAIG